MAPIHWTIEHNSKEIVELLISKGADINAEEVIYLNRIIIFLNKVL